MSNLALKPIETRYRGYRFRSRLEARWAVFFDLMGMQWEYEPEGFKLPSGTAYLPDFKVYTPQGQHIWYEVKPGNVKEYDKFSEFADLVTQDHEAEEPGYGWIVQRTGLLSGDPMDAVKIEKSSYAKYKTNICPRCGLIVIPWRYKDGEEHLDGADLYNCQPCDHQTPSGSQPPEPGVAGITVSPHKGWVSVDDLNVERFARAVIKATQAARSARFEHGENG